jgi:catechol 2,3-dioxygenase-like lactoylglutathione lyase family enzyme
MPTIQTTGIQVIGIYVTDLARAKAFYCDHLGLTESREMPQGVLLSAGDARIYLEGGRAAKSAEPLVEAEVSACLGTDSIRGAHEALKAAGVRVVEPYQEFSPEFGMFRIADPDGNVIEFAGAP